MIQHLNKREIASMPSDKSKN